jgi:hypothetical protein
MFAEDSRDPSARQYRLRRSPENRKQATSIAKVNKSDFAHEICNLTSPPVVCVIYDPPPERNVSLGGQTKTI